ncbi:tRNA-uridine aminocarboxypropyltransferase [Halopseudomonas sp.]|uniref:tRNA-uridine aminocarboxypropyltransferase n=1 Tax=Halopseudomonas sp. TaxID=2901191 RepID=UPI0039E7155D
MNPNAPSRCERCLRPAAHCLCALIPHISTRTQLLVIQHPSERSHALNTARLLVEGVVNAHLLITEVITADSPWHDLLVDPQWQTELLFPGADIPLVTATADSGRPRRLVLLDGTWRKARKLLYLNPVLQGLPRVALPDGLCSRYRLRKAPQPGALSTLEAGLEALQRIEPETDFSSLLRPFEALIDGQIQAMGQARYQENYLRPGQKPA